MPKVQFQNIAFSYDDTKILKDISLDIEEGSFVAILGHNGSGKSTLIKHVNALLLPDSGEVYTLGLNTQDEENWIEIRRNAGMVFQNPEDQMISSVVRDDVAFGPENLGIPRDEIIKRVETSLNRVGMTEFAEADPSELSGGQKQRIAIAGVLAMQPCILLFDEPGAMLDPQGRLELNETFQALKDEGITIIHITHFLEDALLADRVVVLNQGHILYDGSPKEVFTHSEHLIELGLDAPFTHKLAQDLNACGFTIPYTLDDEELLQAIVGELS
ncbi:MAG: energy-coupling factor transporter ATPase [Coriobacteriia bacterium]|nr:energy-coupling factor transporter ATPase [Coriobacteriia bacterium]